MTSQHPTSTYRPFGSTAPKTPGLALPTPVMPSCVMPSQAGMVAPRFVASGRLSLVNLVVLVGLLQEWRQRYRQRRHLARLDHHMLRDIGLSSADVEQEIHKPFWRL